MSFTCRETVNQYAAAGRTPAAPRPQCRTCGRVMAFDGTYPRKVREAGVVHTVFIRRAQCVPCDLTESMLPQFVLRRRLDTAAAVGAAVLTRLGAEIPDGTDTLFDLVPERTQRGWRKRFADRASDLALHFDSLILSWGAPVRFRPSDDTAPVIDAIGRLWRGVRCRTIGELPTAWVLANVIVGGELLSTRADQPWPVQPGTTRRPRGP